MANELIEYKARDGQQLKLTFETIKKYLVRGKSELVTNQELMFFAGICKSKGMNPFIGDCYLIKYSSSEGAAIITSIDYYRKRARAQGDCQGWKNGIVVRDEKNNLIYREGTLLLDNEELVGGWFRAKPKGWEEPLEWTVNLKSYIKKKSDGGITKFWSEDNQPSQIAKVAESQGLRKIWTDEFQGLYVDSEMQSMAAQESFDRPIVQESQQEDPTDKINEAYNEKTSSLPEAKEKPKSKGKKPPDASSSGRTFNPFEEMSQDPRDEKADYDYLTTMDKLKKEIRAFDGDNASYYQALEVYGARKSPEVSEENRGLVISDLKKYIAGRKIDGPPQD